MTLKERVREAYDNARANGYDFATAEEWADDMVYCDGSLEGEDAAEIEKIVKEIIDGHV